MGDITYQQKTYEDEVKNDICLFCIHIHQTHHHKKNKNMQKCWMMILLCEMRVVSHMKLRYLMSIPDVTINVT